MGMETPSERRRAAEAAFMKFDVDRSGTIDAEELCHALAEAGLNVTTEQSKFVLRKYCAEGETTLDLQSFTQVVEHVHSSELKRALTDRMTLRTHPRVSAALDAWWLAALRPADAATTVSAGRRSSERRGSSSFNTIPRQQYAAILRKAVVAMTEERSSRMDKIAEASAEEEAKRDCRGRDFIEVEGFKDGIFELVSTRGGSNHTRRDFTRAPVMLIASCDRALCVDRPTAGARPSTATRTASSCSGCCGASPTTMGLPTCTCGVPTRPFRTAATRRRPSWPSRR